MDSCPGSHPSVEPPSWQGKFQNLVKEKRNRHVNLKERFIPMDGQAIDGPGLTGVSANGAEILATFSAYSNVTSSQISKTAYF